MILMMLLESLSIKLQNPNINKTNSSYHEEYMAMFNVVRFGSTKEVTDHIMYQREVIASLQGQLQNKLMPKVLPSNWISINEKLPEKNTYVLMAATSGYVGATFYTEPKTRKIDCKLSAWFEHANTYGYEVTHWMPLPKAPTQESE